MDSHPPNMLVLDPLTQDSLNSLHLSEPGDGQELSLSTPWGSGHGPFAFLSSDADWQSSEGHSLSGNSMPSSKSEGPTWAPMWSAVSPQEPIVRMNGSSIYISQLPNLESHTPTQNESTDVLAQSQSNASPIVYQPGTDLPAMETETQSGLMQPTGQSLLVSPAAQSSRPMSAPSYIGGSYSRPLRIGQSTRSVSPLAFTGRSMSPAPISAFSRNNASSRNPPFISSSSYGGRSLVASHSARGEHAASPHCELLDIPHKSEQPQPMPIRPEIETFRIEGGEFEARRRKKARVANEDRRQICLEAMSNKGLTQEMLANQYGVERSTISKIVKEKDRWLSTEDQGNLSSVRHSRSSKFPQLELEMVPWLVKMNKAKRPITDKDIGSKAKEIAQRLSIEPQNFKASSGWIDNFKRRHDIKKGIYKGEKRRSDVSDDGMSDRGPSPLGLEESQTAGPFDWNVGRRGSFGNGNGLDTSPSLSSEGSEEDCRGDPDLVEQTRHAFAVIYSWIERQPHGFTSEDELNLLEGLRRKAEGASWA